MKLLVALIAAAGCATSVAFVRRRRVDTRLNGLEARLKRRVELTRKDLQPEVLALAERLGASAEGITSFVTFEQSGSMWRSPGGKAFGFRARETISAAVPGFMWRAVMDPLGSVWVADYFIDGQGGLEAWLGGAITLGREIGSDAIDQGEMLRYLAELPWNPDAILMNRELEWVVLDARTLKVAAGNGTKRGEVTFRLDGRGFVQEASAASRLYIGKEGSVHRPWRGRFWDYQSVHGRKLPMEGEVAWVLDGRDFVYWRGRLSEWAAH